jgi:hypothetical protein
MEEILNKGKEAPGLRPGTEKPAKPPVSSLGEELEAVIARLPPGGVTLGEIRDAIGQDGLLFLTVFLTLVFMVPVSIPGVSTVFGLAILMIGTARLFRRNVWLPKRILKRTLPTDRLRTALRRGSVWLHRLERLSRPHRLNGLASGALSDTVNNGAMILGALLLMAPFGLIPFSNTLPALALLLLAIGMMQRDGVCILLGHGANLATIVYFTVLTVGGSASILEVLRRIFGGPS